MKRLGRGIVAAVMAVSGLAVAGGTGTARAVVVPDVRVGDVTVWEGDVGTLTVNVPVDLSVASASTVSVNYAVAPGTATPGLEFVAKTGKLTFLAGVTHKSVLVTVYADATYEPGPDETVTVTLSAPVNATIDAGVGTLSIRDDDAPGSGTSLEVGIGDVTVTESDAGTRLVNVPLTLSAPAPQTIKVVLSAACSSADPRVDYTGATSRTVTFLAGQRSKSVTFSIVGDVSPESVNDLVESLRVGSGPAVVGDAAGTVTIVDDDHGTFSPVETMQRVSVADDESEADFASTTACGPTGGSQVVDISADGRKILFWSGATNLVPGSSNGAVGSYVRDTLAGTTERVSLNTLGGVGAISAAGRYVVFSSADPGLLPVGTTEDQSFVYDRQTHTTQLVSLGPDGALVGRAIAGDISGDGRFVVFNTATAIYVRDRLSATTEIVASGPGLGGRSAITPDGRFVVFVSPNSSLVPGDTNNFPDVFVRDRWSGSTERVNITPSGTQEVSSATSPINTSVPRISADGRYVVFQSVNSNLTPTVGVFVRDRETQTTREGDLGGPGLSTKCSGSAGDVSDDGRYVSFQMYCQADGTVLVKDVRGVYVRDLAEGVTTRVDVADDGTVSNANPTYGVGNVFSDDGRWVAFGTYADNLVAGDRNNALDVFAVRVE